MVSGRVFLALSSLCVYISPPHQFWCLVLAVLPSRPGWFPLARAFFLARCYRCTDILPDVAGRPREAGARRDVISFRVSAPVGARLDRVRGWMPRSEWVFRLLREALAEPGEAGPGVLLPPVYEVVAPEFRGEGPGGRCQHPAELRGAASGLCAGCGRKPHVKRD